MTTDTRGPILRLISPTLRAIVTAGVLAMVPQAAFAQDNANTDAPAQTQPAPPDPDTVVATVGSEKITERDLNFAAEDLQQQLRQMPAAGRKAFLVSVLIDMKIMAGAARSEDLQNTDEFKNRMNYLEEQTLRRTYFEKEITSKISEDKTKAAYDKMVAAFEPQEEVHARHILVKDKQTADKVEKELKDGKPFEVVAMENSIDTGSAKNGGDLGYFHKGQMVPEFEKAAFSLDVGEVSAPVKSQFGWHIIKVEDRRKSSPPPMDRVKAQLQQQVLIQAFDAKMKQLRAGVKVEIPDPGLAAAVQKQEAASGASNGQ